MSDIDETHRGATQTREVVSQRTQDATDTVIATGLSLAITKEPKSSTWRMNDNASVLQGFYIGRHHTSDPLPLQDDSFEAGGALYVIVESEEHEPTFDGWDTGNRTRLKKVQRADR